MVADPDAAGPAAGILETEDVLLSIDGHPIASDGFIRIDGERVNLNEIIERKYKGDTVDLEIWRKGKKKSVTLTLDRFLPYLMQANQYDKQPQFVLYAGMQFQAARPQPDGRPRHPGSPSSLSLQLFRQRRDVQGTS